MSQRLKKDHHIIIQHTDKQNVHTVYKITQDVHYYPFLKVFKNVYLKRMCSIQAYNERTRLSKQLKNKNKCSMLVEIISKNVLII